MIIEVRNVKLTKSRFGGFQLNFKCENCDSKLSTRDSEIDKEDVCPECGQLFKISREIHEKIVELKRLEQSEIYQKKMEKESERKERSEEIKEAVQEQIQKSLDKRQENTTRDYLIAMSRINDGINSALKIIGGLLFLTSIWCFYKSTTFPESSIPLILDQRFIADNAIGATANSMEVQLGIVGKMLMLSKGQQFSFYAIYLAIGGMCCFIVCLLRDIRYASSNRA